MRLMRMSALMAMFGIAIVIQSVCWVIVARRQIRAHREKLLSTARAPEKPR